MYLDVNNQMNRESRKLPVNGFKWRNDTLDFYEDFKQNYDENSDQGYTLEIDVDYPKQLQKAFSDLSFLPERMKLKCNKA